MSNENKPLPDSDLNPEKPIEPLDPLPTADPGESRVLSVEETLLWEHTETGKKFLERKHAEIAYIRAQTDLKAAEAEDKKAETALRQVQRAQANDDRFLRYISAAISFMGVAAWVWWMCDFIVRCSVGSSQNRYAAPEKVQIALIANTGVAMIGLFAIVLRGLFRVPESEPKKKTKEGD